MAPAKEPTVVKYQTKIVIVGNLPLKPSIHYPALSQILLAILSKAPLIAPRRVVTKVLMVIIRVLAREVLTVMIVKEYRLN